MKIIAVDFDGVLCMDAWPEIGAENAEAIRQLKEMREKGDKIILWTCRTDEKLREAVRWCAERGLVFDAINANLPECVEKYGNDCRKVYADEYWDDKAVYARYAYPSIFVHSDIAGLNITVSDNLNTRRGLWTRIRLPRGG